MNIENPLQLLGGISPAQFMRDYWQKKPLLIRGAIPGFTPLLGRAELFDLAAQDDVESRLVVRKPQAADAEPDWTLRRGPFGRRALPALRQPGWTILVQGVDLYDQRVFDLMAQFRFVPDARLDDLMISYASDTGGVGPHFDNYDVFLLQAQGRRRWRIGRQKNKRLLDGVPLKILADFSPEQDFVLEPGDMLYLPPQWAHDGIAEGECMTYSIGFKSPDQPELASALLQRLADQASDALDPLIYKDADQVAVAEPARLPEGLVSFAKASLEAVLADPEALRRALGEYLSEPKANVWFDTTDTPEATDLPPGDLHLDRRTRMLYDDQHIYINGEGYRAGGRDARLLQRLSDQRTLPAKQAAQLSAAARALVLQWNDSGWVFTVDTE